MASTSSTEQSIVNNGIDDSIQQVYVLEPIVKPEISEQKPTINKHQGLQRYKHIPKIIKNIKTPTVSTKLKYILPINEKII